MADNRIVVSKLKRIHRLGNSTSLNNRNKISSHVPTVVRCVRTSSFPRRHRSVQTKQQRTPRNGLDLDNDSRIIIRSVRNAVRPLENNFTDSDRHLYSTSQRNESFRSIPNQSSMGSVKSILQSDDMKKDHRSLRKRLSSNLLKSRALVEYSDVEYNRPNDSFVKIIPAKEYTLESSDELPDRGKSTYNDIGRTKSNKILHSRQRHPTDEHHKKSRKRRKCCGWYCCPCKPLCLFLTSLASILILSAIAALLVAFIKPASKLSSTSTTTTTTTSRTTATTTTSTSTTTTTTDRPLIVITRAGDPIMGLYNTSASRSTGASNGMYSGVSETPEMAIDGDVNTKYLNFGFQGIMGAVLNEPGVNTGFYVTPTISSATIASALRFATANDFPTRDPITVTLEGTNVTTVAALNLGSSWTLIYSGPTGIHPTIVPSRSTYVAQQNFSNTIAYRSYRLLVTSQRNLSDCVQYSESLILGYA